MTTGKKDAVIIVDHNPVGLPRVNIYNKVNGGVLFRRDRVAEEHLQELGIDFEIRQIGSDTAIGLSAQGLIAWRSPGNGEVIEPGGLVWDLLFKLFGNQGRLGFGEYEEGKWGWGEWDKTKS